MGAAGRTRGGPEPDFNDFEMILGPCFDSFLGSDEVKATFFSGLFLAHFLNWFLNRNPDSWRS